MVQSLERSLLSVIALGSILVSAHDATAARVPIECDDGYHRVGNRCVADPPPPPSPPPTLADCQATNPMYPIAGCQGPLTQAFSDAYAQAQANGSLKPMYTVDRAAYPANLSSTIPVNLSSGASTPWNKASVTTSGSEVTYASVIADDWRRTRQNAHVGPLDTILNVFFSPHDWLKAHLSGTFPSTDPVGSATTTGRPVPTLTTNLVFDDSVNSCNEYVWKVWKNFSLAEDRASMCGADAACAADMLDVPGGPGDTSVSHSVEPSPVRTNGSLFTVPARKARQPKNPFLGASANFFFAQDDMLRYLAANHTTIYCQMPWSGPTAAQTTYASNDPAYADLNDAAKQAELQEARAQVAAQPTYSYGVAPIGGNDTPFANEFAFIRQMMSDTIHAPAPISAAERVAMRERVRHFQALVDAYNAVTTFSCVNTGIQWIGRPQISLPNAHSTPMAVSRETASAARHDGAALGDAMNGGGGGGTPPGQHGTTFVAPPSLTTDQIVAAARALQDQILQAILEEKDRGESGCFSKSRRDCDWFPEDAAPRAVGLFAAEREADFQECVRWTGSATTPFTDGSIRGAGVADVTYRLISLRDAALRALNGAPGVDAPVGAALPGKAAPPTNRQAMGQVIAGNKYIGDSDWFGGGFRYAAFWKVSPASFHGPLRDIGNNQTSPAPCELEGQVHGELHARADVLKSKFDTLCSICEARFENVDLPPGAPGVDVSTLPGYSTLSSLCGGYCPLHYRMQHLVDTQIDLKSTHADGNLFTGEFFFGGERIWQDDNPGENLTSPIHESYPGTPEHVDAIDTTVWVSVVPVTLMVQGEVHYGVDLDAAITNSPDYTTSGAGPGPSISVEARFRPWAYVDAIGSVGIGFDFAQAGVRGRVRVVDASLPVWGKVWVDQKELHAALDAHLDIAIADGSMSVFGKLGPLEAEKEIFSWTGYHDRIQILGYQLPPIAMPVFNESTWSAYKNGTLGK